LNTFLKTIWIHFSYLSFSELYFLRLPKDIQDYRVILMDATVATGAAAMMAIRFQDWLEYFCRKLFIIKIHFLRVLLDHDVLEENISLVSLLMAEQGVHTIAYAFPKVQIITTAVDPDINDKLVADFKQPFHTTNLSPNFQISCQAWNGEFWRQIFWYRI